MTSSEEPGRVSGGGRTALWASLTAFVGLAFWAQLLLFPALGELRYADGRPIAVAVYLCPLVLLGLGVFLQRMAALLMLFPLSLLPPLALLSAPDWEGLNQGANMLWLAATFASYLVVSSSQGLAQVRPEHTEPAQREPSTRSNHAHYRWYFQSRTACGLLVFVVIAYAIFFDPTVVRSFHDHHGSGAGAAIAFSAIFMFFVWCVFVYMMILVPGANVEYDRRRVRRRLDEIRERGSRQGWMLRMTVLISSGLVVSGLTLWFL